MIIFDNVLAFNQLIMTVCLLIHTWFIVINLSRSLWNICGKPIVSYIISQYTKLQQKKISIENYLLILRKNIDITINTLKNTFINCSEITELFESRDFDIKLVNSALLFS